MTYKRNLSILICIISVIALSIVIIQNYDNITYTYIDHTKYETAPIERSFNYTLTDGERGTINLTLYNGVYDNMPHSSYNGNIEYSNYMNNRLQKKYMNELIDNIQSKTKNKDSQARIAISLVQNIPYHNNNKNIIEYPYSVLYMNYGVCSDKSILLAYILIELDYNIAIFDFPVDEHMSVGIKSTEYFYDDTGYAFIESTAPSIITNSNGDYKKIFGVGFAKLSSKPIVIKLGGNLSMDVKNDYQDMILYNKLYNTKHLSASQRRQWESISWKYGLDKYNITENPNKKNICDGDEELCNDECYMSCGLNKISICNSNGVKCELDPDNCPKGSQTCQGKCWDTSDCPNSFECNINGGVCKSDPNNCPVGTQTCNGECWDISKCYSGNFKCDVGGEVCYS